MSDDDGHYWTYREWVRHTVNKIATLGLGVSDPKDREAYVRVQVEAAIAQSLRHGRSGRGDDDPVTP
jgi:hypothetical protein